jgi:hypothetical protein
MKEKVDAVALTEVIDACFDNSANSRFTPAQRAEFLAAGQQLSGSLVRLLSERFDEGTAGLEEASGELSAVNTRLKKEADGLAHAAQTLADLSKLVGALDKLVGVAAQVL